MSAPAPAAPDPTAEDFYARLGAARDAAPEAIRAAYRDAVRRHPPERDAEAFKRVREAFETLDDRAERERYDLLNGDESAAGLFARAERAMGNREYGEAANLFKRVLLEDADAARARNLLGLCFLYQGDPAAAVAQYERLLARHPDAATIWLLNAGHAYRETGRADDARRVLRQAAARPDADPSDVGVALADVEIDARDYKAAHAAIRDALATQPADTPGAVALLLRRLDVHLLAREEAAYHATVGAIERMAVAAQWQQAAAYRLGVAAWKLIDAGAFALARPAAEAAQRLQPEDLDYDALVEVAVALGANNIARARQIVRTHLAFGPGKWLHPLGPRVLAYCDEHAAYHGMSPLKGAPSFTLVNGVGTRLFGKHAPDERTGTYVSTLYFTVLFVPLVPLRRYRVRDAEKRGWHCIGVLPLTPRERLHRNVALALVALLGLWIVITAAANSRARVRVGAERAAEVSHGFVGTGNATPETAAAAPGALPAGVPSTGAGAAPAPAAARVSPPERPAPTSAAPADASTSSNGAADLRTPPGSDDNGRRPDHAADLTLVHVGQLEERRVALEQLDGILGAEVRGLAAERAQLDAERAVRKARAGAADARA